LGTEGVPKQVEAGSVLKWKLLLDKHTHITPTVTRYLVCSKNPTEEITLGTATPGSSLITDRQKGIKVLIPAGTDPDQCHVRNVASYNYFGFKDVEAEYNTPCFDVVQNKAKQDLITVQDFVNGRIEIIKKSDKVYIARKKTYQKRERAYREDKRK
jgi:hypothetical protein